jgi:glycosyltransferase involved in cell wall biosynthesis
MRPRLLFISNLFPDAAEPYRGLDNATILHQLRSKWEIRVISPRPMLAAWKGAQQVNLAPRDIDRCFAPVYVPVRYVPKVGGLFNHQLMLQALRRPVAELQVAFSSRVILASWLFPDGWAASRLASALSVPGVLIAQGSDVHRYLHSSFRKRSILDAVASTHATITRSRSLGTTLVSAGAASSKIHPVHNGVDLSVFRGGDFEEARRLCRVSLQEKLLFFAGNLLPVKNPDLLLQAFSLLVRRWQGPPLRLALAGKGPLRASLDAQASQLGNSAQVTFLGPLAAAEIAQWMRAADVFCMSSLNEGLPNVILEAMASGLPVVSTDVGGIHEIIDAPWKGKLVPSGDSVALATGLREILEDPPSRQALADYGAGLSWETTATAYHAILQGALSAAPGDPSLI